MLDKYIVLNNGVKIPQFGLGTWFIDDDKAADAVKAAAEMGYRHIDTAQAYGNERGVGEGVRNCGIPREEMFVVSKVAAEHKTYEEAMEGINETLEKMGLDYLDMMIIHSPQPWVKVNQSEDRYVEGNRAAWKALEDAYKGLYGEERQGNDVTSQLRKSRPLTDKWTFSTNGVTIMGRNNIPCIGFGPGAEAQAHAPNERTWKDDLVRCAAVYAALPGNYCK